MFCYYQEHGCKGREQNTGEGSGMHWKNHLLQINRFAVIQGMINFKVDLGTLIELLNVFTFTRTCRKMYEMPISLL